MRAAERASGCPSDGELYGRPKLPTRPDQWNDYIDAYAGSQEIHPMYAQFEGDWKTVAKGRVIGYLHLGEKEPRPTWRR
jgi:hypothetical protein